MKDKVLIKKCQNGEKKAFEELIRIYYPYVSSFLLKTSNDKMLSEDLTQETFLKMIRNIQSYDISGRASFGTWIVTIAKNSYIDYLRKNRIYIENIDELQLDSKMDISNIVSNKMEYEEVINLINSLPEEQKIAILLKYEEDMTLNEISERLNVPSKTIKSRIHDGKAKLRKKLKLQERTDSL